MLQKCYSMCYTIKCQRISNRPKWKTSLQHFSYLCEFHLKINLFKYIWFVFYHLFCVMRCFNIFLVYSKKKRVLWRCVLLRRIFNCCNFELLENIFFRANTETSNQVTIDWAPRTHAQRFLLFHCSSRKDSISRFI